MVQRADPSAVCSAWKPDFVAESRAVLKNLRKLRSERAGEASSFYIKQDRNP